MSYLWKGTIVPDVAVVGETVIDKAHFTLLNVLLYGIEFLSSIDLGRGECMCTLRRVDQ